MASDKDQLGKGSWIQYDLKAISIHFSFVLQAHFLIWKINILNAKEYLEENCKYLKSLTQ